MEEESELSDGMEEKVKGKEEEEWMGEAEEEEWMGEAEEER